jgi:cobalt/nickel transport system ATP-binding protein
MNDKLLSIKNVSHHFIKRGSVLNDVSFSLEAGEKLALIGGNGEGKTTLFHIIVGLIPCQQGEIVGLGISLKTEKNFVELRRNIGLVFQDPDDQLFCPSVLEDVMFGPLNQGLDIDTARTRSLLMLAELNLSHLQGRMASELSGGEKRMVTLATVLVMKPKVLLLDEPSNALDSKTKKQLLTFLQSLDQAMIVISHDQLFLKNLTNGVLHLKKGSLTKIDNL